MEGDFSLSDEAAAPSMSHLLSLLGRLNLQIGNLDAAEDAFSRLECLVLAPDESAQVRINRGLHTMATSQYAASAAEFQAALAIEPGNVLAANNAAVSLLYCCKLSEAVATLEAQLRADPRGSMHPALVANLANLYQMTAPNASGGAPGSSSTKPALERLVQATAADDFDMSVLNIGQS